MTLQELKNQITAKSFCSDRLIIFLCPENNFVADQYINAIAKLKNCEIVYFDAVEELLSDTEDLFGTDDISPTLSVVKYDVFDNDCEDITQLTNTIIVAKSIEKDTKRELNGYIIEIPKLNDWQIKDYVYSNLVGVDKKKLDWLQTACKNDIYKISNEVEMLRGFSESEREFLFDDMFEEDMFSDITNFNIFNLTNALTNRDTETLKALYMQKDTMDISDMALLTLACQNFRNLILVHLNPHPTVENTGLTDKQLYAIRKNPLRYSKEELYEIFDRLTDIDNKIKSGDFPMGILFDYILISILGV